MIIFNIPGFTSHNPSRKFDILKKYLSNSSSVIGLSYPTYNPNQLEDYFDDRILKASAYHRDEDFVFIGTSLGGFWARYLALKYKSKCIIMNPALDPCESLKLHIGLNVNVYTNEVFELKRSDVLDYAIFYTLDVPTLALFDRDDELFDYKKSIQYLNVISSVENFQYNVYDGGNHSFIHIKEALPLIKEYINYEKL